MKECMSMQVACGMRQYTRADQSIIDPRAGKASACPGGMRTARSRLRVTMTSK
jgi:hypothetical protein